MTDVSELFYSRKNMVSLSRSPKGARLVPFGEHEIPASFSDPSFSLVWQAPGVVAERFNVISPGTSIIFPQVPATVPVQLKEGDASIVPLPLQNPLQKLALGGHSSTNFGGVSALDVYTSGQRSAIWRNGEKLYRLKGCGNGTVNTQIPIAFPFRIVGTDAILTSLPEIPASTPSQDINSIEIRGAMFGVTACREQAMTHLVNQQLSKHGIPVANTPIGYYKYSTVKLKDANLADQHMDLCCGLYQTTGDKRLASHLLWGLELLIPTLIKLEQANGAPDLDSNSSESSSPAPSLPADFNNLRSLFPQARVSGSELVDTGFAALEGTTNLVNLLAQNSLILPLNSVDVAPTLPNVVDPCWKDLWESYWAEILAETRGNVISLFSTIYWQCGFQVGHIVKLLHESDINWGTFTDLLGHHCNSHPNNLIVLSKVTNGLFLAPLDFDLAFTRDSFQTDKCRNRQDAEPQWQELRTMESTSMMLALAGFSLNSGVEGRADIPASLEPIRIALRDTMVIAYDMAYTGQDDPHQEVCSARGKLFDRIIHLALMMTESLVA